EEFRRVLASADEVIKVGLNGTLAGVDTTLKEFNTTLQDVRPPLATADRVLKNTDATLLGKDAPVQQELRDALLEVTAAAKALRQLLDYLDRHPEAFIRGKEKP